MALKEQANKKNTPRNKNGEYRDGKPLEKHIIKEENRIVNTEDLFKEDE